MMFNRFHLVTNSPFPYFIGLFTISLFFYLVYVFRYKSYFGYFMFWLALIFFITTLLLWFSHIELESDYGCHTSIVVSGLRLGMILFIISEIMFFFGFFWSYFHNCWSPSPLVNGWPPYGCNTFIMDPFGIPLLNTFYLLSSGVSITLCHHLLLINYYSHYFIYLSWSYTFICGVLFLDCQIEEYICSDFSISSSVYGSIVFLLTGFHGFHVFLGLIFLLYWYIRSSAFFEFSNGQHVSFEIAAWYWHFVDVVWLFLYIFVYWYSSIK